MAQVRQVHRRYVERHARRAINCRVGYNASEAVLGIARETGGTVILHVNSGGNALAVQQRLRTLGYQVESTDYDPFAKGNYGVQLRVGPNRPSAEWASGNRIEEGTN